MIDVINRAIEAKLRSYTFTGIVNGIVEGLTPLKIRINDRIVIGLEFIEPKSLGITDDSPAPALPFIVGDKIQLIRYNNGQRFYVLGAAGGGAGGKLDTTNTIAQTPSAEESFGDDIKLHKVSKTGSYNDLNDKPTIPPAFNVLTAYPVGSLYMNVSLVDPAELFGGTWVRIQDMFLLAAGATYAGGTTGGEANVTLDINKIPAHTHVQNAHNHTFTGNGHTHGLNGHTHGWSGTTSWVGDHGHNQNTIGNDGNINPWVGPNSGGSAGVYTKQQYAYYSSGHNNVYTQAAGGHNHTISGTTDGNSGNTASTTEAGTIGNTTAVNQNAGGGQAHNNMPPYLAVYVWKRTA